MPTVLNLEEKELTQKDPQDKISHVVEELKKTDQRLFFALNGFLENGSCVLESPRKVLEL